MLPSEVTRELIDKFAHNQDLEWINIKFAAMCPTAGCLQISMKQDTANRISCKKCKKEFCYICNKSLETDPTHFDKESTCREFSDPYTDL